MIQDIQADEAQRDWTGQRAAHVQELIHTISGVETDLAEILVDIAELEEEGLDELSAEEQAEYTQLNEQERRLRFVLKPTV